MRKGLAEETKIIFWNQLDHWYKRNKIVSEFIRFCLDGNWIGYTGQLQSSLRNICGRILGEEDQWAGFKPKVRNNVRKAIKAGLTFRVLFGNIDAKAIADFYPNNEAA